MPPVNMGCFGGGVYENTYLGIPKESIPYSNTEEHKYLGRHRAGIT